ncbi:hypothetical protein ACNSZH_29575 [Burkholderia gladioli]|uniref:hypothetical protein n=1 Tax=Burkholderia gladioli TaxID=28095 RepID=UPI003B980D78
MKAKGGRRCGVGRPLCLALDDRLSDPVFDDTPLNSPNRPARKFGRLRFWIRGARPEPVRTRIDIH